MFQIIKEVESKKEQKKTKPGRPINDGSNNKSVETDFPGGGNNKNRQKCDHDLTNCNATEKN